MVKWFNNTKFHNKFLFAFGLISAIVVLLALIANLMVSNVGMSLTQLTEGPSRRNIFASDALAEFASCRRSVLAMGYMSGDPEHVDSFFESYQASSTLIVRYLDLYYVNFMNDDAFSEAEKESRTDFVLGLKERFTNEYNFRINRLYAAAVSNDAQGVSDLMLEIMPMGDEIFASLLSLRGMVQENLEEIASLTQQSAHDSVVLLNFFATGLIALTFLISLILSYALKAPITRMEAAMGEIASGDLSYPIRSERRDELGVLSNHIGDMVDTILTLNKSMAILDNIDELIFVTDLNYNLIYLNHKIEELYGLRREDCIGQKCYRIIYNRSDSSPCEFCPLPEMVQNKHDLPSRDWERQATIKGRDVWFACRTSIIRWVDGSLVQIYTCKDNTLHKLDEERQRLHEEELHKAALLAEEASRAKSAFLANMSHEIRTPMNAVMGMSELILRKDLPQDIYENALGIKSASQNLLSIINDILDFSKIESGMLEIIEAEYSFPSLINDIIGIVRIKLMEKPVELVVRVDPSVPSRLIGDENRIRQMLINLLGNAVKYTHEGLITLGVSCSTSESETVLKIAVQDSGIGIKDEDIDKLFGDFVQIDTEKNKNIEGTGLGLAITRSLCLAMGGDITVSSEYGQGSTFTVTLPQAIASHEPFAKVDDPQGKSVLIYETRKLQRESIVTALEDLGVPYKCAENIPELISNLEFFPFVFIASFAYGSIRPIINDLENPPSAAVLSDVSDQLTPSDARVIVLPAHSLAIANVICNVSEELNDSHTMRVSFIAPGANILIVDDIAANLKVAEGMMAPYEMKITTCQSGEKAIELVSSNDYDIVFMDHMMPQMDGLEATSLIRAAGTERLLSLPIIALTANAVSGVREMFIQNGMNDFLAKPLEMRKLNAVLEKWVPKDKQKKPKHTQSSHEESALIKKLKALPTLNVNKALSVMGVPPRTYEDIIKLSIRLLGDNIASLEKSIVSDLGDYTVGVHGIKGVLSNIGAYELSRTALKLEDLSRRGELDACIPLHRKFIEELREFHVSVSALVDATDSSQRSKGDIQDVLAELPQLKSCAEYFDSARAISILVPLCKCTYGDETDEYLAPLQRAYESFDFDLAAALISKLEKELQKIV